MILFLLIGLSCLHASEIRYSSGLIQKITQQDGARRQGDGEISAFLQNEIKLLPPGFEWRENSRISDRTHHHIVYHLYYRDWRVLHRTLEVHFNKKGFIQKATSNFEAPFEIEMPRDRDGLRNAAMSRQARLGKRVYEATPSILIIEGRAQPVFEMRLRGSSPAEARHYVTDLKGEKVLKEFRVMRHLTTPSKAWKISPQNSTNDRAPEDVSLTSLSEAAKLLSPYVYVRREEYATTPVLKDIDPDVSGGITIASDPASYDPLCVGDADDCPNQRIDGINVYYHLEQYRTQLASYFSDLDISTSLFAEYEPLQVIINTKLGSIQNNAVYVFTGLTIGSTDYERALLFFRPGTEDGEPCDGNHLHDLAREALVIVHEYQHYITDTLKEFVPSDGEPYSVADAIHEGYSDYFAASQVSALSGETVTNVGGYGFQRCDYYARDVGTLRVYEDSTQNQDPHFAGLSWASGLWQLREELGHSTTDQIALKSILFLSSDPGFAETVEALVDADAVVTGGVNAGRIRTLFYDEIHWVSSSDAKIADPQSGRLELGFKSCGSVHGEMGALEGMQQIFPYFLSLAMLILICRRYNGNFKMPILILLLASQLSYGVLPRKRAIKSVPQEEAATPESSEEAKPIENALDEDSPPTTTTRVVGRRKRQGGSFRNQLGVWLDITPLWAKVNGVESSSNGFGWGGGVLFQTHFGRKIRLSIMPNIQSLKLKQTVDGGGSIGDKNPITFTQDIIYVGVQVLPSLFLGSFFDESSSSSEQWWLDLGLNYLAFPLRASQNDSLGNSFQYQSADKPLFVIGGISANTKISSDLALGGHLHLLYNLAASGGSKLYGGRFAMAFYFPFL